MDKQSSFPVIHKVGNVDNFVQLIHSALKDN